MAFALQACITSTRCLGKLEVLSFEQFSSRFGVRRVVHHWPLNRCTPELCPLSNHWPTIPLVESTQDQWTILSFN